MSKSDNKTESDAVDEPKAKSESRAKSTSKTEEERPYESPLVPSPGVSAFPTPGAVSEKD